MVWNECIEFATSTVLFTRALVKALTLLIHDGKPSSTNPTLKGTGMQSKLPDNLPSIIDIKRALPKECFEPKVSTSMYYAIRDFVFIAITFAVFFYLDTLTSSKIVRGLLVLLYWAIQGTLFTAIFVIGHDCGHGSFSDYPVLNDVVGTIWHGFLMCPYFMWKMSHRRHHKFNANLEKDEVFYPVRESEPTARGKTMPGFGFGLGWFGYLALGYNPRPVNHFNPFDRMFVGHVFGCFCSLAALGVMSYLCYQYYLLFGLASLAIYYAVPVFIFASYCVVITFLHHSELNIPWYSDDQWDFVRGQLSTIDRHYGIVHHIIHSIGTHQMHHMFTKVPHYRLELATRHFRSAFPQLVRVCDEPILQSFVRMYMKYEKQCIIPDDTKIYYYK